MTAEARRVWLETLCADLAHKTLAEIVDGCRRWRNGPENRWFPTPGQLLHACKSPWDDPKPRRYHDLEDLPPPPLPDQIEEMLALSRKIITADRPKTVDAIKEEILERPPLVMTDEMRMREKQLAEEREAALIRNLNAKGLELV